MRAVSRSSASNGLDELSARTADSSSTNSPKKFINELISAVDADKIKAILKQNDISVSANINQEDNISETDALSTESGSLSVNKNQFAFSNAIRILSGENGEALSDDSIAVSMDELASIVQSLQKLLKDPNMRSIGKDIQSVTDSLSKVQEYIAQLQEKMNGLGSATLESATNITDNTGLKLSLNDLVKEAENISDKLPNILKSVGSSLDSGLQNIAKSVTSDSIIDTITNSLKNQSGSDSLKTALTQDAESSQILRSLKISNNTSDSIPTASNNSTVNGLENNLTISNTEEYKDGELSSDEDNYTNKGSQDYSMKSEFSADNSQIDGQSLGLDDFSNMLKSSYATIRNNSSAKASVSNPTQSETSQTLSDVKVADIPIKLNNLVKTTADGTVSSAKLVLNPAELGTVFVEIQMTEGTAKVKITAESKEVAKALESQVASFIDKLTADGIKTEKVDIGFREQNAGSESYAESNQKGKDAETNKTRRDYLRSISNSDESFETTAIEEEKVPAGLANLAGKIIEKYI